MPKFRERNLESGERGKRDGVIFKSAASRYVFACSELERLGCLIRGINNPVMSNASRLVLIEFINPVDCFAGRAENFDAKVWRSLHCLFTYKVKAGFGEKDNVGTADIVWTKDRINIAV